MDFHGRHAFPSHSTLAERMGVSVRTVQRHLEVLRETGWLTWHNYRRNGVQLTSNRYQPLIPEGHEVDSRRYDTGDTEMSEDLSGETLSNATPYSDNLANERRAHHIGATVSWILNHLKVNPANTIGYLRLVDAVSKIYDDFGRDGLYALLDIVQPSTPEGLKSARTPMMVIASRVNSAALTIAEQMPKSSSIQVSGSENNA
jgi:hypothetical protein